MMQNCGILARRKDGVKIMYRIKHPEVLEILELASTVLKREISGRNALLKVV